MIVQAGGIWLTAMIPHYSAWIVAALLQGIGTAMVYPTLLAAISDVAHPEWRASTMGVYRFWRDLGYAIGALISGIIADLVDDADGDPSRCGTDISFGSARRIQDA
jgi:MFS family permease